MTYFHKLKKAGLAAALLGASTFAMTASADQQILDDLIVDGSICAGQDCVNGESFGFDTLRLKENNLRIRFFDTSNSASFPTRDWQLTANDSSNGGANKFSIDDIDGGRTPFTIEAGAPSHSLFVDDGGRIGVGTSTPVASIHVKDGNTPTLRLEQDGTSGFSPQIWDLAGNEANFFIRDASNGSTLPFRLFPGAPSNALSIEASGDIGVGTTSPTSALSVLRTGSSDMLRLDGNNGPFVTLHDNLHNDTWFITSQAANEGLFEFTSQIDGGTGANINVAMTLSRAGDMVITGGLETGTAGSCTMATPCDGVFDPEVYTVPSIEEHAAEMWENMYLPAVGPTKAGEPLNIPVKLTRMLNELEKAHIYIEQLDKQNKALEARLAKLEQNTLQ